LLTVEIACGVIAENAEKENSRETGRILRANGYSARPRGVIGMGNYTAWRDSCDPNLTTATRPLVTPWAAK
jgi:hypothetical protein